MKHILILILVGYTGIHLHAQRSIPRSYKFDFGSGKAAKGYLKVTPGTIYNDQAGYGFSPGSSVTAVNRGGNNALTSDFITSNKPFFFSVNVPQYLIKEKIAFDPSHPDPVSKWYWPLSPMVSSAKPDGN